MPLKQQQNPILPDYGSYDIEAERNALRAFAERNGLWIPENFYANIRQGDVIDLYETPPSLKQLYCNNQFRELCSYTEEQMKHLPFTKLFWRSDEVQQAIVQTATKAALQCEEARPWNIETHELIETLHPRKRTFEIDLGWVAPCFRARGHERVAFVSSLRVSLIFEWPDFQIPS